MMKNKIPRILSHGQEQIQSTHTLFRFPIVMISTILRKNLKLIGPSFDYFINQEGEYYFRIATIDAWGLQGEFSNPSHVIIEPPLPTKEELAHIARQKREAEEQKEERSFNEKKSKRKKKLSPS